MNLLNHLSLEDPTFPGELFHSHRRDSRPCPTSNNVLQHILHMIATDSSYCNNPFEAVVVDLSSDSLVGNTAYLVIESILLPGPILEIGGKEDFNFSAIIARRDIEKLNG